MNNGKVEIQIAHIVDIDISGPKEQTNLALINMKGKISELGGRVILEKEFSDGFILEISFKDEYKKRLFEMGYGL